jgi:hypothetical protein
MMYSLVEVSAALSVAAGDLFPKTSMSNRHRPPPNGQERLKP